MKHIYLLITLLTAAVPSGILAQSLNKEITVERDIIPEQRDASRIGFMPTFQLSPIKKGTLQYSRSGVTTTVPPTINILDPAAYGDTIYTSPWKGYVSIGLFPLLYNGSVSAGYKLIDSEMTKVGVWAQYDGKVYKQSFGNTIAISGLDTETDYTIRHNTFTLGADLLQRIGETSKFGLEGDYTYSHFNRPDFNLPDGNMPLNQPYNLTKEGLNRFNVNLSWGSSLNLFDYAISAGVSRFAFVNSGELSPARETEWKAGACIKSSFSENSAIGLNIDFSAIRNNRNRTDVPVENPMLLDINPAYYYKNGDITLRAGAKIDISHNAGKAFHIAPDIMIGAGLNSQIGITLRAGGGEWKNTLSSLYDRITPYIPPYFSYSFSHIPFTLGANIHFGPFNGFYANVYAEYAKANDWLMPFYGSESMIYNSLKPINMSGIMGGVAIGYNYNNIAEIDMSAEFSPQKFEKRGYYLWYDRAKAVIKADLRVTPIEPLDINVGYQLRTGRSVTGSADMLKIGNVSNLSAGITWRFDDRLSAFLNGENLMNKKYLEIGLVPAQGIRGLIGASYKF